MSGYRSLWDNWPVTPTVRNPLFPDPTAGAAGSIAAGLSGGTQRPLTMGGTAQDMGDWGIYSGATPNRGPLMDGPNGATHSPVVTVGMDAQSRGAGQVASGGSYRAPGWDLAQNQFQYAIPEEFRANQNFYQLGYDPNRDTNRLAFAGGNGQQTNFDRVYSQMNDLAKANGYGDISQAPPELQRWAANAAIGRLKTDYTKTGADWNTSGFAGYDKYLAGNGSAALGNPNQPKPTGQGTFTPYTPGTPLGNPQQPQPTVSGSFNPAGATKQPTSGVAPLGTTSNIGGSNVSAFNNPTQDPTQGGGGTGGAGAVNVGGFRIDPSMVEDMIKNPRLAYEALLALQGKPTVDRGYGAQVRESKFGQALSAYLAAMTSGGGAGAFDNIGQYLGNFNNMISSGRYFGGLDQAGEDMLGRLNFDQMSSADSEQALRAAQGLRLMGTGPIGRTGLTNTLDDLIGTKTRAMLTGGDDSFTTNEIKNTPFWAAYNALAGR